VKKYLVQIIFYFLVCFGFTSLSYAYSSCAADKDEAVNTRYSCECASPACKNGNSCLDAKKCCELFGNIGEIEHEKEDYFSDDRQSVSYADFRGDDKDFIIPRYNNDAPRHVNTENNYKDEE
jgi:hypothetical protein